jgi:hypothetical protein
VAQLRTVYGGWAKIPSTQDQTGTRHGNGSARRRDRLEAVCGARGSDRHGGQRARTGELRRAHGDEPPDALTHRPASADLDPIHALCGVEGWTIPIGYTLLPGTTEGDFLYAPSPSPVWAAYYAAQPACGPSMSATPAGYPLNTSAYPVPPERVQMEPVEVRFDTAVTTVGVYGMGAFKCYTGHYGTMSAYDVADAVIATAEMQMREPEDCGADSITYGAYGTVSTSSPRIKRLKIEAPQPWSWPVWIDSVFYGTGYVTADYMLVLSSVPAAPATTLMITSVLGPNPSGSFITKSPENRIALRADVTPSSLASRVRWIAADAPDDEVATVSPASIPDGAVSTMTVPGGQALSRLQAAHRARVSQIALGVQVSASVTDDAGHTITSGPVTARQNEIDAMREEYVELNVSHGVPAIGEFSLITPDTYRNCGDYRFGILAATFATMLDALQVAFNRTPWQINVIYRSAAHNRYHADVGACGGASSGVDLNSWHQYGCAADMQTFPAPRSTPALTQRAINYWNDLALLARASGFIVEPMLARDGRLGSGPGHVHVHFCPR